MITEELSQSWLDDGFALVRNVFTADMIDVDPYKVRMF